jgi:tetratricopeptide (TPR) repeat protein/predicted Ser/Thr protein kinase
LTGESQTLELHVGEVLDGKYEIERLLGAGGMGAVYLARRLALGDHVAVKSILSTQNTETNRARFLREARAAAAIRHPNVVQVFDYGQPPGRSPYMVMEYLDGPTLQTVIEQSAPLAPERALHLFAGICAAVEAGHRRGVVHRDLKPGNVILARSDDGRESVKVLDFGLARFSDAEESMLTTPGSMVGTSSYMAPELIESGRATRASDVWALGVVLYEMVIGRSPFKGATRAATLVRITNNDYEPPGQLRPELAPPLQAGIEAALRREPSQRPMSPEQLAALVGAPLPAAGSDTTELPMPGAGAGAGAGALGLGGELDASVIAGGSAGAPPEITTADNGVNQHGGENTFTSEGSMPDAGRAAFVGREHELESLRREYQAVLDGRGRTVVVIGDAGVGKTALVEEFTRWVARPPGPDGVRRRDHAAAGLAGAVVMRGRFFAYEGDRPPPYETFLWMLGQARSSQSAHALGRENRPGMGSVEGGRDKWSVFATMAAAFVEQSRGRPLVLALDDLQWASALELEFLSYLPRAAEHAAVMIVGTARNAERNDEYTRWVARLGSQRAVKTIEVSRFTGAEVRAWFQAAFPGIRIRSPDLRRLQHATSGNPYYLTEVARRLVDEGEIVRDEHGFTCAPLDRVVLPETVSSVVRAKLEGLGEPLRLTLETACVIGEEFRFETLQHALGVEAEELEALLEEAVRRRLLSEEALTPGSDFRFESNTVRDVLYEALGKRRRKRLHKAVVDAVERLYAAGDADRIAKVLAYHYSAVEDHAKTLEWGLRAAQECLQRNDGDHAEASLRRARAAADAMAEGAAASGARPSEHVLARLDWLTGALYNRLGRLDEAQSLLVGALDRVDPDDEDVSMRLDVLLELVECQLGRGDFDGGVATGTEAIEAALAVGDRPHELAARVQAARCAAPRGKLALAEELLAPVIAEPDAAPARGWGGRSVVGLAFAEQGWIHAKRGEFERAAAAAARGLDISRRAGDLLSSYRAVSVLGLTYLEAGDQNAAITNLEEALELARQLSLRRREGVELHNLGEAYYFCARFDDALRYSNAALAIVTEVHDLATEGDVRINIGRMLLGKGETDEGRAMLEHGLLLASGSGRSEYEGIALIELADLELRRNLLDKAGERLQRAHGLLEQMSSLYTWRAELGLAKLGLAIGHREIARGHAARARALLEGQRARLASTMDAHGLDECLDAVHDVELQLAD